MPNHSSTSPPRWGTSPIKRGKTKRPHMKIFIMYGLFFIDGGLSPHLSKIVYNRVCAGLVRRCLPARCPCECPEGVRIGWVLYGFRIG